LQDQYAKRGHRDFQRGATVHGTTKGSLQGSAEEALDSLKPGYFPDSLILNPLSNSNSRLNFSITREEQDLDRLKLLFRKLGYIEFVDNFISNGVMSLQRIVELSHDDWITLGIKPIHRAKIVANARDLVGKLT